ncbi:hypothetical protein GCM10007049_27080 [Echinicola pacifica]|uniref:Uncharacterized protein n=2 Tax=Echinicola pacifica TaxID=346377 RepID=A0A918Q510_9BACT|nr:hypothetical protein GCM10007049_27080 [Echinicola pacifica]
MAMTAPHLAEAEQNTSALPADVQVSLASSHTLSHALIPVSSLAVQGSAEYFGNNDFPTFISGSALDLVLVSISVIGREEQFMGIIPSLGIREIIFPSHFFW